MSESGLAYVLRHLAWIREVWRPHLRWLWILGVLTILSALVTMAYPLAFAHVLDSLGTATIEALPAGELPPEVGQAVLALVVIAVVRFAVGFYPGVRAIVNNLIDLDVRMRTFVRVLAKGQRFFARFRTGDIVTRLTDDIVEYPRIAWFSCSGLFRALESSARLTLCLGIMFTLDTRLAMWSLVPLPLVCVAFVMMRGRLLRATAAQREAASETSDHLEAITSGVQVVQAHNAEPRMSRIFRAQLEQRAEAEVALEQSSVLLHVMFQSLSLLGQALVIVLGGMRVLDGELSVGTFVAFYLYLDMLLPPLLDLPNLLVTGRQAFVSIDRVEELATHDAEGEGGALRGSRDPGSAPTLRAHELSFAHPGASSEGSGRRGALSDVSLELAPGDRLAVVGRIGSGKTTLLRLVAGILEPDRGTLSLGGISYAELSRAAFRRLVGVVGQEPILFSGTIRENLLVGRRHERDRIETVLEISGLARELSAMSAGLEHRLGQRGLGLSGGQRQRLAIARALYGDPELLVLDDITAALDAANEERFWERLLAWRPRISILAVTHRPATARRMEQVIVLEDGRVIARGRHHELDDSCEFYRHFNRGRA
jgi:ABC-type multidrug transport system fused ATPase/permease subunit